ncbi:LexA family transcriptional regulator [Flavobacterium hydrophilum]|uniref:Helix-turn-helix transcriptional regulator n=1 Tax=Flavobacterium hydrophilum TaxID=2211445 RepID=A0A2V4C011_9FLAO|nr:helix-turn-helix domain-containing protein [Flavobacterium hydrophilum]PXY44485.1 helix-turn-helix transcriptional regulator [Flavobacterium hydrophilum]
MDKSLILNRLKKAKNFNTDTELADFLDIRKSTLSNWYTRNSIDYDLLFSKCENEMDMNWLLTGKEFLSNHNRTDLVAEPIEGYRKTRDAIYDMQRVPLFNLEATMGLVPLVDGNGVDEEKVIDYISIPSMPSCDGAIYASGDSMYPLLKSGDMIAYKRIAVERAQIFFGEMYIVAVKLDEYSTMKTIKFVHQSELGDEYVRLVSHNQHHTPKDVKLSQIAAIGLVRASIRLHN